MKIDQLLAILASDNLNGLISSQSKLKADSHVNQAVEEFRRKAILARWEEEIELQSGRDAFE